MKQYISHIIHVLFALMMLSSCEQESFVVCLENDKIHTLTLDLNTGKMQSRSAGVDNLNENRIDTLDIFLYKNDDTFVKHIPIPGDATVMDISSGKRIIVRMTESDLTRLFGNNFSTGNTCKVYAIANLPSNKIGDDKSITALKQLVVETATFATEDDNGTEAQKLQEIKGRQSEFIMDSDGNDVVTLSIDAQNKKSLGGTVNLYRSASKIGLFVHVDEKVTDESGVEWKSIPDKMKMTFHHGYIAGYVGNDVNKSMPTAEEGKTYLFSSGEDRNLSSTISIDQKDNKEKTYYTSAAPYYSYSRSWEADAEDAPYITLIIPWYKGNDPNNFEYCRYQIPVNKLATNNLPNNCLERNTYYQMRLDVSMLGTFQDTDVTELTPSYIAVPWGTENIGVTLQENCYLVVQENNVTINNKNSYAVEYSSSHDVEVQILEITQPYYAKEIEDVTTFYKYEEGDDIVNIVRKERRLGNLDEYKSEHPDFYQDCTVSVEGNSIVLNHKVVNMGEEEEDNAYDIAPYTIKVYVKMVYGKDTNGNDLFFDDTIEYTQYPAIYVEAKQNSDYGNGGGVNGDHNVMVNSYYGGYNGDSYHYTINGLNKDNTSQFGNVPGLSTDAANQNPNMYVIHITSMSDNDYIIGDPRVNEIITSNSVNWANAPALYKEGESSSRKLNYYFRTNANGITSDIDPEDSSNADDYVTGHVIAPVIRVASSYSVTSNTETYETAENRCASYQEDGYPAGRWRMPTFAEVKFIYTLSWEQKIPKLFTDESNYWCAHGNFVGTKNNAGIQKVELNPDNNNSTISIRCVYDEWYWGREPAALKNQNGKYLFTWGDYPRNAWPPSDN